MSADQVAARVPAILFADGVLQHGLLDALGVAAYTTDKDGRLTAYNEAAAALWGYRPTLGDTVWCGSWRLFHSDGTPMAHDECPMAVALREGRAVRGAEAIAARPDGTLVSFIPYPTPLRDAAGALVGAINVLVDISDRKTAQDALAASATRLRAVFETTPECIKLVAPDGTLLQMNSAGIDMIEAASAAQVEGASVFALVAPEHREAWRINHRRVCAGEPLRWEFDIVGLRGTRRSMETHATPLLLPDGGFAQLAITRDVTARKQAEERQALLMREVDHRAKNVLAVALSLVRLTRAEDPRSYAEALEGRIAALAHAHSLLAEECWSGAELHAVLRAEFAPYIAAGRVEVSGPPVWLAAGSVQPVSMVLHELATNAAKYGALAAAAGVVSVAWRLDPESGDLELHWRERNGPEIAAPPAQLGFGSQLIRGLMQSQLGGIVRKHWEPAGLRCEIVVRADGLRSRDAARVPGPEPADGVDLPPEHGLAGKVVLLAEDEVLVAMEMEDVLRRLGCEVVGPAATVEEALRLAQSAAGRLDAAVLDVNLAGRASFPVADFLAGWGKPVLFATGYGELAERQNVGRRSVLLRKPLRRGELAAALARMLAVRPDAVCPDDRVPRQTG